MSGRRHLWRWALLVWAALVVVGGGLTLWLQDSTEPAGPYGREETSPTPRLPEGWETMCPSSSADSEEHPVLVVCSFSSG